MSVRGSFFSGILVDVSFSNNLSSAVKNFFVDARLFVGAILLVRPIGHTKYEWSKPKYRNIAFCSLLLNRTCGFHFKCF